MNTQILSKAICRVLFAAAVATTATLTASAADFTWTGAEDNYWNNPNNWIDKDANRPLPTNDAAYFQDNGEGSVARYEVIFNDAYVNAYRTFVRKIGTAEAPLVFHATDPANGFQFGSRTDRNNGIGDATGDAYLRLEGGTWSTGVGALNIGGSSTFGHVALVDGATFTVGSTMTIEKGELTLTDGTTFSTGNDIYLNNVASKVNISGGSILIGGRYFCLRNGEVTVENATLQNTAHNFELGQYGAVTLYLNAGGVFYVRQIANKTYGGTVLLNGGEIRASYATLVSDNNVIIVKVGALGGTINANGLAVSFNRPIAAEGANDGGMTFKGGGSVSLKYANTYTGATKVELGTKIIATTADAKASVLANLVVTGVAADGDYTVFEYSEGTLTDADLANVTCPGGAAGTIITREDNQIKVHYVAPAEDLDWKGGDAVWATANGWTNATGAAKTWADGNNAIFDDASTVTLGANVTAVSATFNADATIAAGGGTLTVPAVTVASGVSATIAAPTAGALEKTGAGTLTLGASRDDATTLSEGTLAMSPDATLAGLILGTDSAKPITLDYGGGTHATKLAAIESGLDITLKNGAFGLDYIKDGMLRATECATVTANNDFYVGYTASATGTLTLDGSALNVGRNLCVGTQNGSTGDMTLNSGSVAANRFIIGQYGTGTLTINGGTAEVRSSDGKAYVGKLNGTVTLNGGTLIAKSVIHDGGTSSLVFNGGTLKANAVDSGGLIQSAIPVTVNAGGGTIDAATLDVVIKAKSVTGTGGMAYVGGGSVTYSVQPAYAGVTAVEVGTTLFAPEAIAGEKLAFTIPAAGLEKGVYEVVRISGEGAFAAAAIDDATKPADASAQFRFNADRTAIVCVYGYEQGEIAYIGGSGGSLSVADNWTTGVVPTSGNVTFDFAAATTLVVGDTFRADTITISDASAVVTIGAGDLHLSGSLTNANKLAIASGATLTVDGDLVAFNGQGTFLYSNEGTVTVEGNAVCSPAGTTTTTKQYEVVTANTKPIKVGGFLFDRTGWRVYYRLESHSTGSGSWVVGKNGFQFLNPQGEGQTRFYAQNSPVTLYSSANWTLSNTGLSNTSNGDLQVYDSSSLTIDTTDYNDGETPRTVTLNGRIDARGNVTIKGCGKVVVATTVQPGGSAITDTTIASDKTIAVTDTATLQVNAGKKILGEGTISLGAGTTLALDSGALGTVGDLEFTPSIPGLVLPATGTATIRIDGARLKSGDHEIATVASGASVNVALNPDSEALDGRKGTLRVEDGKLMLNIQPSGLRVIIR